MSGADRSLSLRRELGLRQALALGVGGTVGGGIFVLVGVAGRLAGPAALVSFGLAFTMAGLIALPYAELACRMPKAGGGYAFARQVLGEGWGFVMGWTYWGGYVLASGYITIGFGGYLHEATGLPVRLGAAGLVGVCAVLNLAGTGVSGRAQVIVVAAALTCFVGFAAWGLPHVHLATLEPFAPRGGFGVARAVPVLFLAFGGFDIVAAAGEEVRRPERNLPVAILLTLVCVLVLYVVVAFVAFGTTPAGILGNSPAPLAVAAGRFGGGPGRWLVVGCALLTLAATANAVLMATSRVVFAMARDQLLPKALRLTQRRSGTPWLAVAANTALITAMALFGNVILAARAGGFLYVLHFVPVLAALAWLRRDRTQAASMFRVPAAKLVLSLAFACSVGMLVATGTSGVTIGGAWLVVGVAAYGARRLVSVRRPGRRNRQSREN